MLGNEVEETEEELPHVTNKSKVYPLLPCSPFSVKWIGLDAMNDNQRAERRIGIGMAYSTQFWPPEQPLDIVVHVVPGLVHQLK